MTRDDWLSRLRAWWCEFFGKPERNPFAALERGLRHD
jgi:hypothetical protein